MKKIVKRDVAAIEDDESYEIEDDYSGEEIEEDETVKSSINPESKEMKEEISTEAETIDELLESIISKFATDAVKIVYPNKEVRNSFKII